MNNKTETHRWKKDAQDYLKEAERAFSENSHRSATQNAQLCIETSCKAVISYFGEPEWTHSPGGQVLKIIEDRKEDLEKTLPPAFLNDLYPVRKARCLQSGYGGKIPFKANTGFKALCEPSCWRVKDLLTGFTS